MARKPTYDHSSVTCAQSRIGLYRYSQVTLRPMILLLHGLFACIIAIDVGVWKPQAHTFAWPHTLHVICSAGALVGTSPTVAFC